MEDAAPLILISLITGVLLCIGFFVGDDHGRSDRAEAIGLCFEQPPRTTERCDCLTILALQTDSRGSSALSSQARECRYTLKLKDTSGEPNKPNK